MKVVQISVALFSLLPGFAWSAWQGTDEEFMNTVVSGHIPAGVLPPDLDLNDRNLRFAREPQAVGKRCGDNRECEDGVECLRGPLGRYCVPANCMDKVFSAFIDRHDLHDWPEQIMAESGWAGKTPINTTTERLGFGAAATHTAAMMDDDYRTRMGAAIERNAPDMAELLVDMVSQCPQMASSSGVTVMLGGQYAFAAGASWANSFYLAAGTGNINFNVENSTSGVNFAFNISAGIYSDICAGVGPVAGFEVGLLAGAFISGSDMDLLECSFMFDFNAGVGSSIGIAGGVTLNKCIPKFFITQGFGLGAGASFFGCGTCLVAPLSFGA